MKKSHYLMGIIYFFAILLTPALAKASGDRCFITSPDVCIFNGPSPNFGLDLSNDYSLQQLLAEIALKYAQSGNMQKARHIAESLTLVKFRNQALAALEKMPQPANTNGEIKKITEAQKQQLFDNAKLAKDDETKVRVAVEMAEFGLFEESENIRQMITDKAFQSLVLIQIADIYISINQKDIAQEKLAQSVELAMSLECNVGPACDEDEEYRGRTLERVYRRPPKPRL
jgi:hypothetical protein